MCYVLPVLWMMSCFHIMRPVLLPSSTWLPGLTRLCMWLNVESIGGSAVFAKLMHGRDQQAVQTYIETDHATYRTCSSSPLNSNKVAQSNLRTGCIPGDILIDRIRQVAPTCTLYYHGALTYTLG